MLTARHLVVAVAASFLVGVAVSPVLTDAPSSANAQQPTAQAKPDSRPTYMVISYIRINPGQEDAYFKAESEGWKPIHNLRVKEGRIQSWAVLGQVIPGDESDGPIYAAVTTYREWPDLPRIDWVGLAKRALPQSPDFGALAARTAAARTIVRREIWEVIDQTDR
jgi:hypothetical protein